MRGLVIAAILILVISRCNRPREVDLAAIVASVNEKCPQKLDAETRIDRVDYLAPDTLRYQYTLLNLKPGIMDTAEFRVAMWPGIVSHIRVSRDLEALREKGIIFQYQYHDNRGGNLYRFTVTPRHY